MIDVVKYLSQSYWGITFFALTLVGVISVINGIYEFGKTLWYKYKTRRFLKRIEKQVNLRINCD